MSNVIEQLKRCEKISNEWKEVRRELKVTQDEYIELLCNDVGLDTRATQNDWISNRLGRRIKFLDEMNSTEKSLIIGMLKDKKAENAKN